MGGDLNDHVCKDSDDFDQVHQGYGYGTRNDKEKATLKFSLAYSCS